MRHREHSAPKRSLWHMTRHEFQDMKLTDLYKWQIEFQNGEIINQYDLEGQERSSKIIDANSVVRVSYIPVLPILPKHDIVIDKRKGEYFIRRFQRGFIKHQKDGFKLREYLHCCITNRYRVYIFSSGNVLITHKDYELYL